MLRINLYGKKLYHSEQEKEDLYKFLRECKEKQLTQTHIAELLKVSQPTVCYHAGKCDLKPWLEET